MTRNTIYCGHWSQVHTPVNLFGKFKTKAEPILGEGWEDARCLKPKAESPLRGDLAFLLEGLKNENH